MKTLPRIYLDNAATSWPKPPEVYAAVEHAMREIGAPAGRSAYAEASEAQHLVSSARLAVARLFNAEEARRIVFTFSGTDALNTAIHGVVRPGDHVVTTEIEHNSVLRPLKRLEETQNVSVTRVPCNALGLVDPDAIRRAITSRTRLVVLSHASNVTGAVQPVADVARIVHAHDALLLVDAAQSAGNQPLDVRQLGADLLAAPGHKGLLGPLGTGVLYISPRAEPRIRSFREGGTGTQSGDQHQPQTLPDKFEAGNLNVPGIAGLGAGVAYLQRRGVAAVEQHLVQLMQRLITGLREIAGVRMFGPIESTSPPHLLSLAIEGYDPHEAAVALDAEYRIQVRSGLHCAPLVHRRIGSLECGGTVRISPGLFSTIDDIDAVIQAVAALVAASTSA